ncbi:MAG: SH3 domain-containing protein [Rhodanobacter sp.]
MRILMSLAATVALALVAVPTPARSVDTLPMPAHGVVGVEAAQLTPSFWLARLQQPDRVIMDARAVADYGARVQRLDPYVYDVRALPATLDGKEVDGWIRALSTRPTKAMYDVHGQPIASATFDALVNNLALDTVPTTQAVRFGLVVHRAALRGFPTTLRVFSHPGDTDIDRLQESAMVPGTPVAILHESRDQQWLFVEAPRYRAWVEKKYIAVGSAAQVFGYVDKTPWLVVTGDSARTVFTPEQPAVSQLQLDMGTRVPVRPDWPADQPVNGQGPSGAQVIELPLREADGSLGFTEALLQKTADTRASYLPLTQANIVKQAFKFLGERYGWGHAYDGRDCSGFIADVYRSMGILMPRNTSAQSISPAANHTVFTETSTHAERMHAVAALQVGDLIYIPGHVMMVLGHLHGQPYVIHDVLGASFHGANGAIRRVKLNEVSVTPLLPLLFNDKQTFVDRMTSIVRIRPSDNTLQGN